MRSSTTFSTPSSSPSYSWVGIRHWLVKLVFTPLGYKIGLQPLPVNKTALSCHREDYKIKVNKKRSLKLKKFCETGWRWLLYLAAHLGGIYCLYDKPWVWDASHCWYSYPFHPIDRKIWWYYMMELALYWCLFITQFSDIKRKDFWQMFVHHLATISLLMFSWTNHMHRMGSLILLLHDFSDHWLELAKLFIYADKEATANGVFVVFCTTWIASRLSILPTVVIYSTTFAAGQVVAMFPVYYIFNFLLTTLQILHVLWTYYILMILYKAVASGAATKDSRSDDENTDADDEAEEDREEEDMEEDTEEIREEDKDK